VRVQQPDGSFQIKPGPYVEPVQLQVVCQSLWRVKGDSRVITAAHLEQLGGGQDTGVDDVPAAYYAERVARAAAERGVSERTIRDWFGKHLMCSRRAPAGAGQRSPGGRPDVAVLAGIGQGLSDPPGKP